MTNKNKCTDCLGLCHPELRRRSDNCPCKQCIVKVMCLGAILVDECDLWADWYFENADVEYET